jgi:hypothetical protein
MFVPACHRWTAGANSSQILQWTFNSHSFHRKDLYKLYKKDALHKVSWRRGVLGVDLPPMRMPPAKEMMMIVELRCGGGNP